MQEPAFWDTNEKTVLTGCFSFCADEDRKNEKGEFMNKRKSIGKWLFVIVALAVLITAMVWMIKEKAGKEPEGKYILRTDAYLLYTYLYGSAGQINAEETDVEKLASMISQNGTDTALQDSDDTCLTLGEAKTMFALLMEKYPVYEGEIEQIEKDSFVNNHRDQSALLAQDFLDTYEKLWSVLHKETPLYEEQGIFMAAGSDIRNLDDSSVSENDIVLAQEDDNGMVSAVRCYRKTELLSRYQTADDVLLYQRHIYYGAADYLLLDISEYREQPETEPFDLKSCWISSNRPEALWITYEDYQLCIRPEGDVLLEDGSVYDTFEDIADLHFAAGKLQSIATYDEKVSGKLLGVSEDQIELEGMGFYSYKENLPVYKLYGQREYYTKADLKIGYDFTDFVLDQDGVIVAGLVTREEKMDSIRVVIKTTGFASAYHEQISFTCDSNYLINDEHHMAGEEIVIEPDDPRFQNGRIYIRPETNLARTTITSIERDQGTPAYRGNFEIAKTDEGLLLINELLLEEYLYSVVPSEMPAGYPAEALKAQAISARTYAYQRMCRSGLKEYGAHVDDSAAFQVYNNIKESESTTLAIRETQGQVAVIGNELAETYYYSTSCGYGTDIDVWHSSSVDDYDYLVSRHIGIDAEDTSGKDADITDEAVFRDYIKNVHPEDYECNEGWYRWQYDTDLDIDRLNENLLKRYQASSKSILIPSVKEDASQGEASVQYLSGEPPVFTQIQRIAVVKREDGGVIDELLIEGKEGSVKVVGEHAVRSVLANVGDQIVRQDGSRSTVSTLLPSAFAVLDVQVDSDTNSILSYTVTGGGYGHGIGMSQNAAKAMALAGLNCENILQFFYDGVTLIDMYEL